MAGVLSGVLGAPVQWIPEGGGATSIQAIFRETPVRVADEDGSETLLEMPTVHVQLPEASAIRARDTIVPGNGKTYRVGPRHGTGSPAADAFVIFELELLT